MYCILINLDKSEHGCVFHISDLFQYCAPVFKDLHVYPRSRGCRFSYFDAPRITLVLVFGTRTSSTYYTIKCTVVLSVVHVRFVCTCTTHIHDIGMCYMYTKTLKICCFCSCENAIVWHIQCSRCLKALDPSREYILPNTMALTKKH